MTLGQHSHWMTKRGWVLRAHPGHRETQGLCTRAGGAQDRTCVCVDNADTGEPGEGVYRTGAQLKAMQAFGSDGVE